MGIAVPTTRRSPQTPTGRAGLRLLPTYLLGTVLSVQIWEKARAAIPDVDEHQARKFHELHMASENIYRGRKFTPAETVASGRRPIDPRPYLRYLRDKLEAQRRS